MDETAIEALLDEGRLFPPSAEFCAQATVNTPELYERADADPEAFWASVADELHWFRKWDTVLEWQAPFAKWFQGGTLNAAYNCLDRYLGTPTQNKVAIHWEGEPGDERTLTYRQLWREVCKFANVLKSLGVSKGDRVTLYMPMIPELAIACLACARIGAPHSVVFGGFSAESLRDRINDSESKVVVTADGGYRRGSIVALKQATDEALEACPTVEKVVVVQRVGAERAPVQLQEGRDLWWHDLMPSASADCPAEEMDAEDL
ncbi:MAG TPA: AMP-binding protein, partial [Armatimonadota bacterium]|nr:AMP-binding protein [Armatimonadota bacterium]